MTRVDWSSECDTGIDVIDKQHRRIVDYINQLHHARTSGHSREEIDTVMDGLIDYTQSHFAFEESLQEEAGYPLLAEHKKVHDQFIRRIDGFRTRFAQGEEVAEELNKLLVTWLFHHIRRDDADYVPAVKETMLHIDAFVDRKKGFFSRLFG